MYVQDNDETLFGHTQGTRSTFYPQSGNYLNWPQQMYPYVMNEQLFTCPSRAGSAFAYDPIVRDNNFGYGMNYWQLYYYYYGSLSDINTPAQTIWFADCNFYVVYPSYYMHTYPDDRTYGLEGTARLQNRHNEGANIGFLDGHAKWLHSSSVEGDIGLYENSEMWWGRDPR
jgi:prepilin-type processing-associated H-X9-DG protein